MPETTADVDQVEARISAVPACSACADTGQVCPDPFGEWTPWAKYVADMEARRVKEGWPLSSSAIAAGLIRPMACPVCKGGV